METSATQTSTTSVGLRYGLLTGLVSVIISFILSVLQLEASPARHLVWPVLIAGIVLCQLHFKQRNAGFMNYGPGLGTGMVVTAVAGLLSSLFAYVYVNFIEPEALVRGMEKARHDMEARGGMTDAQIDQAVAMGTKFASGPLLIVFLILMYLLIGLVVSLITSAIIKNSKPEFE
jgi:hypothetical protein